MEGKTYNIFPKFISSFLQKTPKSSLSLDSTMDWQGQKVAEQVMQIMLVVFAIGAFITGYVMGSFQLMLFIYAGGVVLTTLITIPNWPFFNRHPLQWLDSSEAEKHPKPQATTGASSKKQHAKK